MTDIEFELKQRFADLRADDGANGPVYGALRDRGRVDVERSRLVPRRPRWIGPALLATAAAALAAVWVMSRASRGERTRYEASVRDSIDVFRWTMPTDGLLESARRTLQTPALSASVLDAATVPIPGTPFKGD
jgi:hypothetical protein